MVARILLSFVLLAAFAVAQAALHALGAAGTAGAAAAQLANSDTAALAVPPALAALAWLHMPAVLLGIAMVLLWRTQIGWLLAAARARWAGDRPSGRITGAALAAGLCLAAAAPAHAFYATTDVTEVVYILPNWSAFFIPDTGANRDSQAAFGSVDYLNASKIAAKRFIIPHAKLSGTGGVGVFTGPDYYVPTGRMIIVDRTPFFREWVDAADRGTSARKQGFCFETRDSVNICTGITVSAFVPEQNAATFLYWFGTRPVEGDASRPEVQFASVLHGMSLSDVMDGIVRAKVQEALSGEFGKRTFDAAIGSKPEIIKAVADAVKAEFEPRGISIGFLGYSGPLDFSPEIQGSIDRTIIATREKAAADTLKDSLAVLKEKAVIDGIAAAVQRWDGKLPPLPSLMVLPAGIASLLAEKGAADR